jgi:hypothetical protein
MRAHLVACQRCRVRTGGPEAPADRLCLARPSGYAIDSAVGFRVLRAVGHEAENELPFSAAQQLCLPGLAALGQLPAPQREALGVAFGQVEGPAPDRLLVGLALLGLLSALASGTPVLCVIDDAQWLDRESARAFAFAARRLGPERIGFVFGARAVPGDLGGLPDVMATLRNAVTGILKTTGYANIAAACRYHARDATRTLATLGLSPPAAGRA